MTIEILIAFILLAFLVFLATVDMAFGHLSDVSLRRLAAEAESEQRTSSANFLRAILENRPRFRFALSSTIQILLISFTVLLTLILLRFTENQDALLFLALAIGLAATVALRQVLPRLLIKNNTEHKLLFLLPAVKPIYRISSAIFEPFASRNVTKDQQRLEQSVSPDVDDDDDNDSAEDFQALMEVGEAEGIIEEREREMIETMVEFSDTRAGEIMTPRTEICAVPIDSNVSQARDMIVEEKFSRLPVYRETIDNIEGIIYVRDLLQAWSEGKIGQPVEEIMRDAYFVPETISAADLLRRMQVDRVQMAVVIDEYGGVAGLVTVEDIIEEIVGEIEDEDTVPDEIIEIIEGEDGYFDVLGSTDIDKIERLFDVDLDDGEYTTIAGLVTTESGHVPKTGEKLCLRGMDIEVLKADEKKLHLLRLRKTPANEAAEASSEGHA